MSTEEPTLFTNDESFLLDDIIDQRSFKEAVLKRAAKISPLVTSVTLGPNSSFLSEHPTERRPTLTINRRNPENEKPKRDISTNKSSPNAITTNDLLALQRTFHFQNEERKLKEQVRKRMEERLFHERIHNERIQTALDTMKLESERKYKAKTEAFERQLEAALKLEEQDEMVYQNQRMELAKNTRKILEQQEKELRDNLKRLDDHFVKLESGFNRIVSQCDPDMSQIVDLYKQQFEDLKVLKNSNRSSIDGLRSVCIKTEEIFQSLLKHSKEFEALSKVRKAQKEAEDRRAEEERQAAEAKAATAARQVAQVQPFQRTHETPTEIPQSRPAPQSETGRYYYELMQLINNKQASTRHLTETRELETIRFALKFAVNNPVNMLNEKNKTTLSEGFQKLHNLLTGQRITTSKGAVSITDHPEASDWTKLRIAEKLIDACDKKTDSTFYIAALTVALWQKFPDFGRIFLAKLFKECPFLVPYKPPQLNGQSDSDFLESWGYRRINDRPEQYSIYQSRTSNLAALMAAIWITTSRRDESAQHPFGIENGWKYLVNILNAPADPMYLHIVSKILEISGSTLHLTYGKQFVKLMLALRDLYLPNMREVDEGMKAAYDRLRQITIAKFFQENRFSQPKGKLTARYW